MTNKIVEKFNNNKDKIMNILQKINPIVLILQVLSFAMLFISSIKINYIEYVSAGYPFMHRHTYNSKWFSIQKLSFFHTNVNGEDFKGAEFLFILFAVLLIITIIVTLCEIIQRRQLFNPMFNIVYYVFFGIITFIFFGNIKDVKLGWGLKYLDGGHVGDKYVEIHKETMAYVFFTIVIITIVYKLIYYLSRYYIDKKDNNSGESVDEK